MAGSGGSTGLPRRVGNATNGMTGATADDITSIIATHLQNASGGVVLIFGLLGLAQAEAEHESTTEGEISGIKQAAKVVSDKLDELGASEDIRRGLGDALDEAVQAKQEEEAAPAPDDTFFRLYLTTQFDEYIEFQGKDVAAHIPLAGSQYPIGGVAVWFANDALLSYVRRSNPLQIRASSIQSTPPQVAFLQGNITGTALPQVVLSPYVMPGPGWGGQLGGWGLGPYAGGSTMGCSTLPGCPGKQ